MSQTTNTNNLITIATTTTTTTPTAKATANNDNNKPLSHSAPVSPQTEKLKQKINSGSATGNPRNKCALKPGHSLMDWIRLGSSGCDLAGTKGIITPVSSIELSKHNKKDDAWLAIRGKVFNVTHYMDFHPGGVDEMMKGVGRDATKLFDDIHAWVNYDQLLSKCYVGPLRNTAILNLEPFKIQTQRTKSENGSNNSIGIGGNDNSITRSNNKTSSILQFPFGSSSARSSPLKTRNDNRNINNSLPGPDNNPGIIPRFDWIQKTSDLILIFYTKQFCNPGLIITYKSDSELLIRIIIERTIHLCKFKLLHNVNWPCGLKLSSETGKIEVTLVKTIPELWTSFGTLDREKIVPLEELEFDFQIASNHKITHDSFALTLKPTTKMIFTTPIGFHISLTKFIDGNNVTRSYTPVPSSYVPVPDVSNNSNIPLLIKSYTTGVLAKYITSEPIDSPVIISQPKGNFCLSNLLNHSRIGLLVAGSGLTPILSILDHLLGRLNNKVEHVQLMIFNKTEEDIWCRKNFETIAVKDKRLVVRHILSEPNADWIGEKGRISENLILPLNDPKSDCYVTFCCVCGPTPFNDLAEKILTQIGFGQSEYHFFQG